MWRIFHLAHAFQDFISPSHDILGNIILLVVFRRHSQRKSKGEIPIPRTKSSSYPPPFVSYPLHHLRATRIRFHCACFHNVVAAGHIALIFHNHGSQGHFYSHCYPLACPCHICREGHLAKHFQRRMHRAIPQVTKPLSQRA